MNNKKFIRKLSLFALFLIVSALLTSCSLSGKKEQEENNSEIVVPEVVVESIQIDRTTIPERVFAGQIPYNDIILVVTMSDGSKERIKMSESYIAVGSRNKLDKVGTQQLEVVYGDCRTSFQLDLLDSSVVLYTLVIEGGIPISVNGNPVNVEAPIDGIYTNQYLGGTVVEIAWTESSERVFAAWQADGVSVDNQSTTYVFMNADHEYKAVSYKVVYMVNFTTFKENYDIPMKTVERLYAEDAEYDDSNIYYDRVPMPTMDGYVFAGWTLEEINLDQALSGTGDFSLVEFTTTDPVTKEIYPYLEIEHDMSFCAVWTPTKINCTSFTPSLSGYTQKSGCQVVEYNGNLTNLTIPDFYDGLEVLAISNKAFSGENAAFIETITIPATVLEIEEGAFANCSSLKAIYVEQDSPVFSSENGVLYKDERATLVAYPANRVVRLYEMESNVSTISPYAFYNAVVGEISVAPDVASIGSFAFDSIHIDTVDFSKVAVTKLNGPKSKIGENIFNEKLSYILLTTVDADIEGFRKLACFKDNVDKFTSGAGYHRISTNYYGENGEYTILFRLITGGDLAQYFTNTGSTAEIIGVSRNIKEISIPNELIYADNPYTVSSIAYYAFKDCKKLDFVDLPNGLERVTDKAFDDTPWLKNLTNKSIIDNNILYKYVGNDSTYTLPEDVARIAESAFENNKTIRFLNLSANDSLKTISAMAFSGCENLTSFSETYDNGVLLIKSRLTDIDAYAFTGTAIKEIRSSEGSLLRSIGEYAFYDCRYLLSVRFCSVALAEIDSTSFLETDSLYSYEISVDNDYFVTYNGILYQMTANTSASLFAYPSGKIMAELNPSDFKKKYVTVNGEVGGTFSVLGQEYTVEIYTDTRVQGYYTETNNDTKITFELTVDDQDNTYFDVNVIRIGENALYHSNIGALHIERGVQQISPIRIPGLKYIRFDVVSGMTYSRLFPSNSAESYDPTYVYFPNSSKSETDGFFNNEALRDEKYVHEQPLDFFVYENNLYYVKQEEATLARTCRDIDVITIPQTIINENGDTPQEYTKKHIDPYAFGGWYLTDVIFKEGVSSVKANAMGLTHRLHSVLFEETLDNIPMISKTSLGKDFDNGLLVYIPKYMTLYYINKWNSGSEDIISSFNYMDGTDEKIASSYLIEYSVTMNGSVVPEPFALLTFRDENGEVVTVGSPLYGFIRESDIQDFHDNDIVQKEGYVVGGWTNDKREDIVIGSMYKIPYNQILTCGWEPREYRIYLEIFSEYTPDFVTEYDAEKEKYVLNIQYHSNYEWNLRGLDERYYYLNGWSYWSSNSAVGKKTVPVKGLWSLALDSAADRGEDIIFTPDLKDRKYTLEYMWDGFTTTKVSVSYNSEYKLDIPQKNGYLFKGWYYVATDGQTLMLTNERGDSILNWSLTTSENDLYSIYPKWEADVVTVELYFDKSKTRLYKRATVVFDSDNYVFVPGSEGDDVVTLFTDDEVTRFSGWTDYNGVIYTDTDGKSVRRWDMWEEGEESYALYAAWPVEVATFEDLCLTLESSMNASIILTADIEIVNNCFGNIDTPYAGVFNGNGKTITYKNIDNSSIYSGLFARNEGIIKNLNLTVEEVDRNLTSSQTVYIGTVCAVNNNIIEDVNVFIHRFNIRVDSQYYCFYDVSDAYNVGLVCGINNGKMTGRCEYNYSKDTSYYQDETDLAVSYFKEGESSWSLHYSEFYIFDDVSEGFVLNSVPFYSGLSYYKMENGNFVNRTEDAVADYQSGNWNTRYNQYYYYRNNAPVEVKPIFPIYYNMRETYYIMQNDKYVDRSDSAQTDYEDGKWNDTYSRYYRVIDGQYVSMTEALESDIKYYKKVEDIFKKQSLFNTGSGSNEMTLILKEK